MRYIFLLFLSSAMFCNRKPFVNSKKGGERGGGAELTETARQVVQRYRLLTDKLYAIIKKDADFLKLI